MKERALRAISECRQIATMSEEAGRTTRRFLTTPVREVHAHLRVRMEQLGMTTHVDAAGNLRGLWQPAASSGRRLLIGSHIDTVPDAGAFDGVLGVTLALEWVGIAQELELPLAIEVLAFSEEEGIRFGVPFLGSRAVAGRFDASLLALRDASGATVEDALRAFGLDPARIGEAAMEESAAAFVEVHIEQGPVLELEELSLATVSAIFGQTRLTLEFAGQAGHAGTTPMSFRRDALAAAAQWIVAVEARALNTPGLVATVGKIEAEPNAGNVIAGRVEVCLDVRHERDTVRLEAVDELLAKAEAIARQRAMSATVISRWDQPAVPMDEQLTAFLTDAMEAAGLAARMVPSGAGHDAMVMAARVPTAMLFLRSPGAISHHPAESVRAEDVEASLRVAREFLLRLSSDIG